MVKIGVIGCGKIMRNAHIGPTLGDHPDVRLTAYYDVDREAAEAFAEDFGGEAVHTEREVCQRCDAVYIAIPPNAHGQAERACLETGTPFFVEKPQALDLSLAEDVAAEVQRQQLITMVGYQWRYTPSGQAFRKALKGRTPVLVNMWWYQGTPRIPFNRYKAKSGGQVVEQVTHIVDTVRYAVGEIVEVFGWQNNVVHVGVEDWDNDDVGVACVRFAGGALGTITNCYALTDGAPPGNGAEVLTQDRRVLWQGKSLTISTADGEEHIEPFEGPAHRFEDLAFIEAVKTGGDSGVLSPYADSANTLAVTLACARSGEAGEPIAI
ncbi:MAG: Gfo/Idh/MocA family oxidoreductase [Armatimonadota bacterium]|nr:Gfo/Idh/MocA family oxidoreductase [Armatimonadota bacterium]